MSFLPDARRLRLSADEGDQAVDRVFLCFLKVLDVIVQVYVVFLLYYLGPDNKMYSPLKK
jgi:hypothetical protein